MANEPLSVSSDLLHPKDEETVVTEAAETSPADPCTPADDTATSQVPATYVDFSKLDFGFYRRYTSFFAADFQGVDPGSSRKTFVELLTHHFSRLQVDPAEVVQTFLSLKTSSDYTSAQVDKNSTSMPSAADDDCYPDYPPPEPGRKRREITRLPEDSESAYEKEKESYTDWPIYDEATMKSGGGRSRRQRCRK